jgi:hypothetical protein
LRDLSPAIDAGQGVGAQSPNLVDVLGLTSHAKRPLGKAGMPQRNA